MIQNSNNPLKLLTELVLCVCNNNNNINNNNNNYYYYYLLQLGCYPVAVACLCIFLWCLLSSPFYLIRCFVLRQPVHLIISESDKSHFTVMQRYQFNDFNYICITEGKYCYLPV